MRSSTIVAVLMLFVGLGVVAWLPAEDAPAKQAAKSGKGIELKAERGLKSSPITTAAIRRATAATTLDADEARAPFYDDGQTRYVMLNLEFADAAACKAFALPGSKVITRFDRFADVFIPASASDEDLAAQQGLVWYDISTSVIPPPSRPIPRKEASKGVADKIIKGDVRPQETGKGVVLAIVDSGIDFRHSDFVTIGEDGQPTSRLLFFWDTTSDAYANGVGQPAPYSYPNDAPIGTVYDRETMTADIRGGKLRIPVWDPNGHGTACAGVAAGNGNGNAEYKGVAPEADLIAVRIGTGDVSSPALENGFMLNAICEWLDKVAGERPLVVSCSFGGHRGGHDGQTVEERHLSARFSPDRKGRAICVAAGNEGEMPFHASAQLGDSDHAAQFRWKVESRGFLELYLQTDNDSDIRLDPLGSTDVGEINSFIHPLTKQVVVELPLDTGAGGISLYSKSGTPIAADAYIYGDRFVTFDDECLNFGKQIGSPATALNVLSVGSYDWNDEFHMRGAKHVLPDTSGRAIEIGKLSSYSNPGPLRYGDAVKPEIVAPGQWYAAAAPLNINPYFGRDSTGLYQRHNGTSAATPYAAGVIALIFDANPQLTWGDVRKILIESASHDVATGDCPNPEWGHGKLNYAAVEKALAKARATTPAEPPPATTKPPGKPKPKAKPAAKPKTK